MLWENNGILNILSASRVKGPFQIRRYVLPSRLKKDRLAQEEIKNYYEIIFQYFLGPNNLPYCEMHYNALYGDVCNFCNRVIQVIKNFFCSLKI